MFPTRWLSYVALFLASNTLICNLDIEELNRKKDTANNKENGAKQTNKNAPAKQSGNKSTLDAYNKQLEEKKVLLKRLDNLIRIILPSLTRQIGLLCAQPKEILVLLRYCGAHL